jgi:hypothetical protein
LLKLVSMFELTFLTALSISAPVRHGCNLIAKNEPTVNQAAGPIGCVTSSPQISGLRIDA